MLSYVIAPYIQLSRSEIEKNYQKLMKEHMELQRLHALLTAKSGTYHDPQRELKVIQLIM